MAARNSLLAAPPYEVEQALKTLGANIRTAYAEPRNAGAREAMMLGASEAGLAFSNSSVALVHGMSRPLGAHFHVPHGLSNAMLLPVVTRFSVPGAEARYAEASRRIGFAAPSDDNGAAAAKLVVVRGATISHALAEPLTLRVTTRSSRRAASLPVTEYL